MSSDTAPESADTDDLRATTRLIPSEASAQALRLSVVLPLHNEVDRLAAAVDHLFGLFRGLDWELVLIDLGSDDGTHEYLERLAGYPNLKVLSEEDPLPLGHGHRLGALVARGEAILLAEVDRPLSPRRYRDDLVLLRDQAPLLLYTPQHPDGSGTAFPSRFLARRVRRMLRAPLGHVPLDPVASVPLLRRDQALAILPWYRGSSRMPACELIQLALLGPEPAFVELPANAEDWPSVGWLELPGLLCEARGLVRRVQESGAGSSNDGARR